MRCSITSQTTAVIGGPNNITVNLTADCETMFSDGTTQGKGACCAGSFHAKDSDTTLFAADALAKPGTELYEVASGMDPLVVVVPMCSVKAV